MDCLKYKLINKLEYLEVKMGTLYLSILKIQKSLQSLQSLKDNKIATRYSFNGQFKNGILVTGCPKPEMKNLQKYLSN